MRKGERITARHYMLHAYSRSHDCFLTMAQIQMQRLPVERPYISCTAANANAKKISSASYSPFWSAARMWTHVAWITIHPYISHHHMGGLRSQDCISSMVQMRTRR